MMAKRQIPPETRQLCYERDSLTCQAPGCGVSRSEGAKLNLHHIVHEQFGGTEEPNNLITLCDIHHKEQHIEFSAYYTDSASVLERMNRFLKGIIAKIRSSYSLDEGQDLKPYLRLLTGQDASFRRGQLAAIRAAISGQDILFVAATGTGKSVCYQLPGIMDSKPSLVVCPTKSLMKDQVESIWHRKIPATFINSDISIRERQSRYQFIKDNLYKFIFVAPERFYKSNDPQTSVLIQDYAYLVIDEAHSVTIWGRDFRPSYRRLGELRDMLGGPPVIALTATASKRTQKDVLDSLGIPDAKVIVTGIYKNNIQINIKRLNSKESKYQYIERVIQQHPDDKIVVFVLTIKTGNELLDYLNNADIKADFYHGSRNSKDRMNLHNAFSGRTPSELKVMIATSGFGMGVDIADIRQIIHLAPPINLTDYVQQLGRAGRDGQQSFGHLLYQTRDKGLMEFMAFRNIKSETFMQEHNYTVEDVAEVRSRLTEEIDDMLGLIGVARGREWRYILDYFGEDIYALNHNINTRRVVVTLLLTLAAIVLLMIAVAT